MADLSVRETPIPGLLLVDQPVHGDSRGWFKENWQREKMIGLGLPDFVPVQNNISFNEAIGTTRGIHAEPWDKYISIATGRIFGAWVDLREGEGFGTVFTAELDQAKAIFVPKGVGNSYQTLEPNTAYTYLVTAHWSPDAEYTFLNVADKTVAIEWPIPLDQAAELSDKDKAHPRLAEVTPIVIESVEAAPPPSLVETSLAPIEARRLSAAEASKPREKRVSPYDIAPTPKDPNTARTLILGANGQLGRALVNELPSATAWTRAEFDISDPTEYHEVDWAQFDIVINAAAYTKVDEAETLQGRRDAWRINVHGVVELARAAIAYDLTLIHISSDYVFDGEIEEHTADEFFSPLGVYGQTKAAGDAVVATVPKHYIVRTSWVIGDGPNFVRTMRDLAANGINPAVIDDQVGRLSYTSDLATSIRNLISSGASFETVNVTGAGDPMTWWQIARDVFVADGHDPDRVQPISTEQYGAGKTLAPRPRSSYLS